MRARRLMCALVAVLAGAGASAGATLVVSPVTAAEDESWIKEFKDCQESQQQTAILFLLDESKSLVDGPRRIGTDPGHARVASVKAALSALAALTPTDANGGEWQKLFVAIDGFGSTYHPYGSREWKQLDRSSLPAFLSSAEEFVRRTQESTTDYRQALRGADEAMARYRAMNGIQEPAKACQLVIWFTDGAYDTGDDSALTDRELKQLKNEVCNKDGLADVLREHNILLLATGLSRQASLSDFSWLKRIAEAEEGCGNQPRRGDLDTSTDPNSLLDAILRPPLTPDDQEVEAVAKCAASSPTPCREISFSVASWMTGFRILVKSSSSELKVTLETPGTNRQRNELPRPADDGPVQVAPGVTATAFTDQRSLLLAERSDDVDLSDWVGTWTIRFEGEDAEKSSALLAFLGEITAEFEGVEYDRAGRQDLVLYVGPKGDVPQVSGLEKPGLTLMVDITLQAGASLPLIAKRVPPDGRVTLTYQELDGFLEKPEVLQSAKLFASVKTTAIVDVPEQTGIKVELRPVETSIRLRTGDGYPQLLGAVRVTPETFDNVTTGRIEVRAKGPKQGDGYLRVTGLSESPTAAGTTTEFTLDGPEKCDVPTEEEVTCPPWTISTSATANRDVRLYVQVVLGGGEATDGEITSWEEISFTMTRPLDEDTLVRTLVLLIGLFVLIQLVLKLWAIFEFARFAKLSPTARVAVTDVVVDREGQLRSTSGGAPAVVPSDLPFAFDFQDSFTSKQALGLTFSVSRLRAALFHPTFGIVRGDAPVVSRRGFVPGGDRAPVAAKVDLDLSGRWILAFDDAEPAGSAGSKQARLVVFLHPLEEQPADRQIEAAVTSVADSRHVPVLFALLDTIEAAAAERSTEHLGGAPADPTAADPTGGDDRSKVKDPYTQQMSGIEDASPADEDHVGGRRRRRRKGLHPNAADERLQTTDENAGDRGRRRRSGRVPDPEMQASSLDDPYR